MIYKTVLLFGGVEQLIAGLELQEFTQTLNPRPHTYVLDDCFPIRVEENLYLLSQVKKRWEDKVTIFHNDHNMGIHKAFNRLCSLMPLQEGDIIITVAPDTVVMNKGWDTAMVQLLNEVPSIAYTGTSSFAIRETKVNWQHKVSPSGLRYVVADAPAMSHASAFRWSFLKKCGGFHQPLPKYGHLEAELFVRARNLGLTHSYLEDYEETFPLEGFHNDTFRRWKLAHAHSQTFMGSFAEYLAAGHK